MRKKEHHVVVPMRIHAPLMSPVKESLRKSLRKLLLTTSRLPLSLVEVAEVPVRNLALFLAPTGTALP